MIKKVLILTIILLMTMQSVAFAQSGKIILKDMGYGTVIGFGLGTAVYLLDTDAKFGDRAGTGIALGVLTGFIVGVAEVKGLVQVEDNKIKFAMPAINVIPTKDGYAATATILNGNF